jgi:hypothetical protein
MPDLEEVEIVAGKRGICCVKECQAPAIGQITYTVLGGGLLKLSVCDNHTLIKPKLPKMPVQAVLRKVGH